MGRVRREVDSARYHDRLLKIEEMMIKFFSKSGGREGQVEAWVAPSGVFGEGDSDSASSSDGSEGPH